MPTNDQMKKDFGTPLERSVFIEKSAHSDGISNSKEILEELRAIRQLLERQRWGLDTPLAAQALKGAADD